MFLTCYLFCLFVFSLFADYRKFTRAYQKDCVSQAWQAYQQQLQKKDALISFHFETQGRYQKEGFKWRNYSGKIC